MEQKIQALVDEIQSHPSKDNNPFVREAIMHLVKAKDLISISSFPSGITNKPNSETTTI